MARLWRFSRFAVLGVSAALYAYSLSLPALLFEQHEALPGITVLAWGWWGILVSPPSWVANPVYFYAVFSYVMGARKRAVISAVIAVLFGLTAFLAEAWWFHEGYGTPIAALGEGFYVWMLSFLYLLLGCAIPVATTPTPADNTAPG